MPRKIKIVDLVNEETNEKIEIEDTNKPIDEKITDTESIVQNIEKAEIEEEVILIKEEPKITTKERTNQLHECTKCGKWMTLKTLKYIHDKTCNSNNIAIPDEPKQKKTGRPKKQIVVEDIKTPNPIEEQDYNLRSVPLVRTDHIKSFEEMRQDHLKERIKHRTQRMSNLFSQAF
jgi:hypothetical protein